MFLAIDIGNTTICIGVYEGKTSKFISRIATNKSKEPVEYIIVFKQIFEMNGITPDDINGSAISSVVPEVTKSIINAVSYLIGCTPMVLGPGIKTGMKIMIDNPAQLGADLLAGCIGAAAIYALPCIVIDMGTATKISVIDKDGNFRGCAIAPGVKISLNALSERTSQLPNISLNTPDHAIGTNTLDSMQSGTVYGFASMIDGLCDKFEAELNQGKVSLVATGGLAQTLVKSCSKDIVYNGELVLYGLKVLYEKNFGKLPQ